MTIFLLKLRSAARRDDAIRALRRLLKYARRACGFTCIDATEIPAQPDPDRAAPGKPGE
jgi:hypothetical protein